MKIEGIGGTNAAIFSFWKKKSAKGEKRKVI